MGEKLCYLCGDVGYEELFLTCRKCKSSFIHPYCMNTATVEFSIPDDFIWICEDCEKTPKHAASKFIGQVSGVKRKVKLIPTDESIALANSQSSLLKGKIHFASPKKPKNLRVCSTEKPSSLPSAEQIRCKSQKSCVENRVHSHTQSPISKRSPELQSSKQRSVHEHTTSKNSGLSSAQGGTPCKDTLKTSNNAGEKRPSGGEETIQSRLSNHPASCATWKGSFKISGYASSCNNDVWGYPPSKVGRKAYEFSKKMPGVLQFEVIPRSTVWADMFVERGPDENDIGLYLFPRGDSSELISYLEKQDIVLRSSILGVQFLIFSSSHLDEESKKINQAYYLWGLFVPPVITFKEPGKNQFPSETNNEPAIQHVVDNEVTANMEIGVPIPRGSHRSCSEMSKAAASAGQRASEIQVKLEKWDRDDLASPPKVPAHSAWVEPRVPPGFEGLRRL